MRCHVHVHIVTLPTPEVAILALKRLLARMNQHVHAQVLRPRERLIALVALEVAPILVRNANVLAQAVALEERLSAVLAHVLTRAAMLLRLQVRRQTQPALERLATLLVRTQERAVNVLLVIVQTRLARVAHVTVWTLHDVSGRRQQVLVSVLDVT